MTKKELNRKMSRMFWKAYEEAGSCFISESSDYCKFLEELDRKFDAGEISEKALQWAHEIDDRLNDQAQC